MQINQNRKADKKSRRQYERAEYIPISKTPKTRESKEYKPNNKAIKTSYSKEDAIIDLYEDPFKNTKKEQEEDLVINIDFTKPAELVAKLYQKVKNLAHVAQSKISRFINDFEFGKFARNKKQLAIAFAVLLFITYLGYGTFWQTREGAINIEGEVAGETNESVITNETPKFQLLFPEGRTHDDYSSLAIVSPPGAPESYAYLEYIGENIVQVSQQELPDRFSSNLDGELEDLALNFAATNRIDGDNFTAYLGQYDVGGPQSLVAVKNDRLILIKSKTYISPEEWGKFMQALQ